MSSFKQNLQKFFVYFFTGASVIIVVLGISRIGKKGEMAIDTSSTTPGQGGLSSNTTGTGTTSNRPTQSTFNGRAYQTPWGNLAVAVQVKNGRVVAVTVPTLPDSPPSQEAKAYLIEQAVKSGGANIQGVTGATITSLAFKASLESALSQAANAAPDVTTTTTTPESTTATNISLPSTTSTKTPATSRPTATQTTAQQTQSGVNGTFTGNAYSTPWGNAVASITVANGKITGVTMPVVPNSPPSIYAEPYLVQQALAAGSANIQGVSGATYASIAFKSSLESAISKANTTASAQGKGSISTTPAQSSATTKTKTAAPSVPRKYRNDDNEGNERGGWDD